MRRTSAAAGGYSLGMMTLDLAVLIAYMVGILGAGYWAKTKVTSQDEFLVAGRSVGPWLYAGTLAAIGLGPEPAPLDGPVTPRG